MFRVKIRTALTKNTFLVQDREHLMIKEAKIGFKSKFFKNLL